MAAAGVDAFTFHVEVTSLGDDLSPFLHLVKSKGMKVGLAVKPRCILLRVWLCCFQENAVLCLLHVFTELQWKTSFHICQCLIKSL